MRAPRYPGYTFQNEINPNGVVAQNPSIRSLLRVTSRNSRKSPPSVFVRVCPCLSVCVRVRPYLPARNHQSLPPDLKNLPLARRQFPLPPTRHATAVRPSPTPTGLRPPAQGCAVRATLGNRFKTKSTPTGLWQNHTLRQPPCIHPSHHPSIHVLLRAHSCHSRKPPRPFFNF